MSREAADPQRLRGVNALLEGELGLAEHERSTWLQGLPTERQVLVPQLSASLACGDRLAGPPCNHKELPGTFWDFSFQFYL